MEKEKQKVISMNINTTMVVKSTIPVGFIESVKVKYNIDNIHLKSYINF